MFSAGLELFRGFLRSEFSDENLEFWIACEEFKLAKPSKISAMAQKIYTDFVAPQAPREVRTNTSRLSSRLLQDLGFVSGRWVRAGEKCVSVVIHASVCLRVFLCICAFVCECMFFLLYKSFTGHELRQYYHGTLRHHLFQAEWWMSAFI